MILYNNIVKISKNRWIGYMLKVAFLMASSILGVFLGPPHGTTPAAVIEKKRYFKSSEHIIPVGPNL